MGVGIASKGYGRVIWPTAGATLAAVGGRDGHQHRVPGVVSDCHFVAQLNHFISIFLTLSLAVFSEATIEYRHATRHATLHVPRHVGRQPMAARLAMGGAVILTKNDSNGSKTTI